MSGLLKLYETLTRAGKPLLEGLLRRRLGRGKEDPARIGERRGVPSRPRPPGPLIWLHAASVGEAQSALILIDAMGKRFEKGCVLVTTGTTTSAQLMEQRLPAFAFHQYVPIDQPDWVESFLNHWKPDLALWMESELWPNMLIALKKRGMPAALVNARLSDRSFANWKMAKGMVAQMLSCFSLILTQTENDAAHFRALLPTRSKDSSTQVIVTDNLKYSAEALPHDDLALSVLKLTIGDRPLWVFASTHAGEEALACRVHKRLKEKLPDLLTIIVPRHPARRDEIARTCLENNIKFRARSAHTALPAIDDDVYLADTLGELGLFYSLCPVAVIGRSFSDDGGGGHNPIEAAQLGCAVITGPNNQFQQQIYGDMIARGAVLQAQDEEGLYDALDNLLTHPLILKEMQDKAESFAKQKAGVIDTVIQTLAPLLSAMGVRNAA